MKAELWRKYPLYDHLSLFVEIIKIKNQYIKVVGIELKAVIGI